MPARKKLPPALAKNALAKAEVARAKLLRRAHDDVSLIKRKQTEITDAFYDIGEALIRLRAPGMAEFGDQAFMAAGTLSLGSRTEPHLFLFPGRIERLKS